MTTNKTSFESLVNVSKIDNEYGRKFFLSNYVMPKIYAVYGKNLPVDLSKDVLMGYAKKAICDIYGLKSIVEISKKQAEEFNHIFPLFK